MENVVRRKLRVRKTRSWREEINDFPKKHKRSISLETNPSNKRKKGIDTEGYFSRGKIGTNQERIINIIGQTYEDSDLEVYSRLMDFYKYGYSVVIKYEERLAADNALKATYSLNTASEIKTRGRRKKRNGNKRKSGSVKRNRNESFKCDEEHVLAIYKMLKEIPTNLLIVQKNFLDIKLCINLIWTSDEKNKLDLIHNCILRIKDSAESPNDFRYIRKNIERKGVLPKGSGKKEQECDCHFVCDQETCLLRYLKECKYKNIDAFKTKNRGWGVRALEPIEKGEFILELCGELKPLTDEDNSHYKVDMGSYSIDCLKYGNIGRLVNHSCVPNTVLCKYTVGQCKVAILIAKKIIEKHNEITFCYANNVSSVFKCLCGEATCASFGKRKNY